MIDHIILSLLQHPRIVGLFGFFVAAVFGIIGVSSVQNVLRLPDSPSVATTAQFVYAIKSQEQYWAILPDPQWDCSTLIHTTVGDNTHTEIFIRDPEILVAILVTYTKPIECAELDPKEAVGVGWLMSEKHIQNLEQEGRLASFRNYHTFASLCTTCGKQNSIWLIVLSAIFMVIGLAIYPLVSWAEKRASQQERNEIQDMWQRENFRIDFSEHSHRLSFTWWIALIFVGSLVLLTLICMFIINFQDIISGRNDLIFYLEIGSITVLLLPFGLLALAFPFMTKVIIKPDNIEYYTPYYVLRTDWNNIDVIFSQGTIDGKTIVVIPQGGTLTLRNWVKPFHKIFKNQIQDVSIIASRFGKFKGHSLEMDILENLELWI